MKFAIVFTVYAILSPAICHATSSRPCTGKKYDLNIISSMSSWWFQVQIMDAKSGKELETFDAKKLDLRYLDERELRVVQHKTVKAGEEMEVLRISVDKKGKKYSGIIKYKGVSDNITCEWDE